MSSQKLNLALGQMTSGDDLGRNVTSALDLLDQAKGADLLVLPENALYFRIRSGAAMTAPEMDGPEINRLRAAVDQVGTALMLTTAMRGGGSKFRNATLFFEPGHSPQVVYAKIHLFDVDVEGAPRVRESEVFEAGGGPATIDFQGWKLGLSICYDLRFAELYASYAQQVDLILVPSAFLVPTGRAHWHTLLRARAIETQAFVAAPAQSGDHVSGDQVRQTYGHSLAVNPWGQVLLDASDGPGVHLVELDREMVEKVRRQIPMGSHRRLGRGF